MFYFCKRSYIMENSDIIEEMIKLGNYYTLFIKILYYFVLPIYVYTLLFEILY